MTFAPDFLRAVVDTLLPGLAATETKPALPAASAVGCGDLLAKHLMAHRDRAKFAAVLAAIGDEAAFWGLDGAGKTAVLQRLEQAQPEAFNALLDIVSADYYESAPVLRAFGWRETPPQPEGYPLPPFDEGLLAQARQKRPFWRKA